MYSDEERGPRDIEFARDEGRRFASLVLSRRVGNLDWRQTERLPSAQILLTQVLRDVRRQWATAR